MVKTVITNLDSSKVSGPDCIFQWWFQKTESLNFHTY